MSLLRVPAEANQYPWLVCAFMLLASCAAEKKTTQDGPPPSGRPSLERLLPLKDETISQFESVMDGSSPGMFVLEIYRPRPDLAELRIAGRVQRLLIDPGRIRHAIGGSLLEEPLELGHSFRGSFGQVEITEIDATVTVPAGEFRHCLLTVEESSRPPRRATSAYCPDLGLVKLVVEAFGGEGGLLENSLVQHGPRYK